MPKYVNDLGTWLRPEASFEPIYDVQIKGLTSLVKLRCAVRSLKKENKDLKSRLDIIEQLLNKEVL